MRTAVQRQADAQGGGIGARQQQAVAAKVVETDSFAAQAIEQAAEAPRRQQLRGSKWWRCIPGW
jgi:hypothetical protein